jgi:enoyl-CoA hydratase
MTMTEQAASGCTMIRIERDGPILHVVLNRPEKRNALTPEMLLALQVAFRDAEHEADVRVVVLRAEGPDFCAGFDLSRLRSDELPEERMIREEAELYDNALAIRNFPKPTIAAVQGSCIAGGLLFSQMCDLIVADEKASFYNPLIRMGGVGLELLMEPWDLGIRRAKRYLFTGERIPADVALKFGMITDVVSPERLAEATAELATKVAAMPPMAMRLLKKSINRTQDLMGMRAALDYHFAVHEFGHTTQESQQLLHEARERQSLKEYFAKRDRGGLAE